MLQTFKRLFLLYKKFYGYIFMLIKSSKRLPLFHLSLLFLLFVSCRQMPKEPALFTALQSDETGLQFSNKLTASSEFNMFRYMYFYNGAGVGAGDFNNDGQVDLFFSSNQSHNKLFLNTGNLKFKDVTAAANIPQDSSWSTGVSVTDINNDGLLDIYICKVGNFESLQGKNQFLICTGIDKNGVPQYADKAPEYGVDFSGFSTQAAFLDYDMDGDLDMFLLNHSVHQNGTFAERKKFLGTFHPLTGHRMFRNDGNYFTDVTRETGINSSAIGYGLGIAVSDVNLDGYPDIYIGNDFHENDYLYINQKNGKFRDELNERIMHTSKFSMGVDIGDVNNDAYPEIITMDMLPSDPYILKRSLGEDEYHTFYMKIRYGYNHQYAKNALQWNRGNGNFSEIGMYAGISATDWSWAALWMDFDNDGLKDLFISNGIPKRLNDIDYVNYVSNEDLQQKIKSNAVSEKEMSVINNFPQIKLPNKFYRNKGNLSFEDLAASIKNDLPTYSNGSVYADFDNDGDLDVVVNNIDDDVLLYQNHSNDKGERPALTVRLKGAATNTCATGTKLILFAGNDIRTYEKFPVRGFQSSMETPLQAGLANTKLDSIFVIWPDNRFEKIQLGNNQKQITITYKKALPLFDYSLLKKPVSDSSFSVMDVTKKVNLQHHHEENPFNEFDREPLIPYMVSREGPALAVTDINHDGLDDIFIGSSKRNKSAIYIQEKTGRFHKSRQAHLDLDSTYEDVDACWVDLNNDKQIDLVIASGGNEYYGSDKHLSPRVYINDGRMEFKRKEDAFSNLFLTASCIASNDINGDGYADLFIGGRSVPWDFGEVPKSYLLLNDHKGGFHDVTETYSKELKQVGFVTSAKWADIEGDGDEDLVLSLEWDGICAFVNEGDRLTKKYLTVKKGWWNFVLPLDADDDGDMDFIAGNLGENSRLKVSEKEPVRLYYNDFDGNGKKEQVFTYYLGGREIPFANKAELEKQMPFLKKKFLYAENFANASLFEIFSEKKLNKAGILSANYFSNAILINNGNYNFSIQSLPWQAQLSPYKDAALTDANGDNLPDVLLGGNFFENNIQMGRYDADLGTLLINKGGGKFMPELLNGLSIKGQVRHIKPIQTPKGLAYVLARNNDSTIVIQFNKK